MNTVLELKDLSLRDETGHSILHEINLMVTQAERICIQGDRDELAALARVIGGIDRPTTGEVHILGQSLNEMHGKMLAAFRGAHIGHISRDPVLWSELTVLENTALPLTVAGVHRDEREGIAYLSLEAVGLEYSAHVYPKSLSLCELRIAALARALVRSPSLLILEDALAGLDQQETCRFTEALDSRWSAESFAVLHMSGTTTIKIYTEKTLALLYGRLQGDGV